MGLRKLVQDGTTSYMYTRVHNTAGNENEIKIIVVEKNNSFTLKLSPGDSSVVKWSHILKKTPQEYLSQLNKAVVHFHKATDELKDSKEDIFEVQEEYLVWKQYFPKQKVYGKRGKFKLEKVPYEDAVSEALEGTLCDLETNSKYIQKLTTEVEEKSKKLNNAMDLAARSVIAKEEFEKEIYGKCAAIINAKKLRIQQLKSSHPSSSVGRPECLVRSTENPGPSQPSKKARCEKSDSDCYNSDTDIDDPDDQDMDTDDENRTRLSPCKQKQKTIWDVHSAGNTKVTNVDSQDLFDDSLEAELYPSSTTSMKRTIPSKTSVSNQNGARSIKNSKANKAKTSEALNSSVRSQRDSQKNGGTSNSALLANTQKSIFDELF
ncbi:uncharacterized protein [Procambarus clarkii]|uniref:uncharacterized protein isoform X2 n=1 Tax=Procambarus clarkii TaxID=6728 RepID=UPI001E6708A2|nr:uncharacterized protein LOC123762125 isoform X2 [Procambarus clarkii]